MVSAPSSGYHPVVAVGLSVGVDFFRPVAGVFKIEDCSREYLSPSDIADEIRWLCLSYGLVGYFNGAAVLATVESVFSFAG